MPCRPVTFGRGGAGLLGWEGWKVMPIPYSLCGQGYSMMISILHLMYLHPKGYQDLQSSLFLFSIAELDVVCTRYNVFLPKSDYYTSLCLNDQLSVQCGLINNVTVHRSEKLMF